MSDEERIRKIEDVLEQLRPNIQMDGGDITFSKYVDSTVYIKLHGACVSCLISSQTIKFGVEQALREVVPDVVEVLVDRDDV